MKAVIAEDNPFELRYLKKLLTENDINVVGEAATGDEAYRIISERNPEVVFLDISMPGMDGLQLAKLVDKNIFKVFVTADHFLALEAFEIGSVDYLLKPVTPERIAVTIERIKNLSSRRDIKLSLKLSLTIKGSVVTLDIDDICFIEKLPLVKKVTLHLTEGAYTVSGTLNEFEEKLSRLGFVRSHSSFIVNVNKIDMLIPWGDKSYLIKMKHCKKEVFASRKYAPTIKSMML